MDPFSKDQVLRIESEKPTKASLEALKYGESLMEAVDFAHAFVQEVH